MRKLITDLLESDPGVRVVGTASDGLEALHQIATLRPDVVTLDVQMPRLSGLEALERIMRETPVPVVMLSGLDQPQVTLTALELGAVDFVVKPSGPVSVDVYKVRDELLDKVKVAVFVNAAKLFRLGAQRPAKAEPLPPLPQSALVNDQAVRRLVIIAASTGGPRTLDVLLRGLPGRLSAAILVVQHMPKGFTSSLARRLDAESELEVGEAQGGEMIKPGKVYIAPAGHHLVLEPSPSGDRGQLGLDDSPPLMGLCPAADVLMESAALAYGERCVGIVLTGMGSDGTRGIEAIKRQGGHTIAQDQATSVIYGMPRSAVESGFVDQVLPLEAIASAIVQLVELA